MNSPLVSVIIPVYNTEKYLKKCVESVLNQTYRNLEIWLIDDGSTDSSPKICDEFAQRDERIHVIHKENAGQGIARNLALDKCSGDFISFVDSDDWVQPEFIDKLLSALLENKADIAVCGYQAFTGLRTAEIRRTQCLLECSHDIFKKMLQTPDITTMSWDKLYSRKCFQGLRYPAVRANEDAYLIYEMMQNCEKMVIINECDYVQLIRPGSTEQSAFSEKNYALIGAAQELTHIVEKKYPDLTPYVQFKTSKDIVTLLQKVVFSGMSAENEKHFNRLLHMLKEEISYITPQNDESISELQYYKNIVNNPKEYQNGLRKQKILYYCKQNMKKIALLFRGY